MKKTIMIISEHRCMHSGATLLKRCCRFVVLLFFALFSFFLSWSQVGISPKDLKKLSIEELMNLEVSLASRKPEKLTESASAIQVITNEDIRRSGATNIPEALRLLPNLHVAQLQSNAWLISARGFNNIFSNKLLVMIDGRTVYTPLYGGVLWDQQNVLLEDIERIEVVSGPGGTLWGANAVNGVINIVTKNSAQTKGLYAMLSAGTFVKDMAEVRYGGRIGERVSYKVYGQHFDRKATQMPDGNKKSDAWDMSQAGFRLDWNASQKDVFTLQGDYFDGALKTVEEHSPMNGQNVLARWSRAISGKSDISLQLYFDRYYRKDASLKAYDEMNTVDADFQHGFPLGSFQNVLWGVGYRFVKDDANYSVPAMAGILPRFKRLDLFNAFIQDDIRLADSLRLIAGTKLTHNVYTGFEWQPSGRLVWTRNKTTLWGAASRAIRTPSRLDVDYFLPMEPQPPGVPSVAGGPNFISEKLVAYELGYRFQPNAVSSFSIATFYNVYRDLYSVEALPGTLTYQIQNGSEAESWGAELSGNYNIMDNWRLRGGYTFFKKDIRARAGHNFNPDYLGNDVRSNIMLQSILDLPYHIQLDLTARYLDPLPQTFATAAVSNYTTFDARLAYTYKGFELALVGQNLAAKDHTEFGTLRLPRHFYAKISARF